MNIYKSTKVLPYVYMCTERDTGNFYIGYRFANRVPSSDDLGKKYFTSNHYVKQNFDKFDCIIIAEFFDRKSAYKFESMLINETKSEKQINMERIRKNKRKRNKLIKKSFEKIEKICPWCGKLHYNWRSKCCCLSHTRRYAASLRYTK